MSNIESQIDPEIAERARNLFRPTDSAPSHSQTAIRADNDAARRAFEIRNAPTATDTPLASSEPEAPKPAPTPEQGHRNDAAARYGLSEEIRDLYLSNVTDPEQMARIAAGLMQRGVTGGEPDPRRFGNVAPREGSTRSTGGPDTQVREFTARLFGRDPNLNYTRSN